MKKKGEPLAVTTWKKQNGRKIMQSNTIGKINTKWYRKWIEAVWNLTLNRPRGQFLAENT